MLRINFSIVMIFCIMVFGYYSISYACTEFILPFDGNSPIISGRTGDFAQNPDNPTKTFLIKVPVGLTFKAHEPEDGNGASISWKNKYGFVGVALRPEKMKPPGTTEKFYCDGLNTEGFSAAVLAFTYAEYEKPVKHSKCVYIKRLVSYLLGTCATVDEAREKLDNVIVLPTEIDGYKFLYHLSVHDINGKSMVVEFIKGKKIFYNNDDIGVLTNTPAFDWQATHFMFLYNGLTQIDNIAYKDVVFTKDQSGQFKINNNVSVVQYEVLGSGMFGLPGDSSSPARFVRAAKLRECVPTKYDEHRGVQYALQVLGRISLCEQEILLYPEEGNRKPGSMYTLTHWMIIRNHTDKIIYYYTHLNHNIQAIKLDQLEFTKGSKTSQIDISVDSVCDWYVDSTSKLK